MDEAQFEEWRQKEQPHQIAVETSFVPTVDIEYIENLSLESIVIQKCFIMSYEELKEQNPTYTSDDYRKYLAERSLQVLNDFPNLGTIQLKYVPENSLLAKAYCLEDPFSFERYNRDYCNSVKNKHEEARHKQEQQKAQESWEKYLK